MLPCVLMVLLYSTTPTEKSNLSSFVKDANLKKTYNEVFYISKTVSCYSSSKPLTYWLPKCSATELTDFKWHTYRKGEPLRQMYSQKLRITRMYLILTAVYGGDHPQELWLVTLFYYWLLPHQQRFSCFLCDTLLWKQTAIQNTGVTGTRHSRKRLV